MNIRYTRRRTAVVPPPKPDEQVDVQYGKQFDEVAVGANGERPQLDTLIKYARYGDVIHIDTLHTMFYSLVHFVEVVNELKQRKIAVVSADDKYNSLTDDPTVEMLADLQRDCVAERVQPMIDRRRSGVKCGGKPPLEIPPDDMAAMIALSNRRKTNGLTVVQIAEMYGISKSSYYEYVFPHTKRGKAKEKMKTSLR